MYGLHDMHPETNTRTAIFGTVSIEGTKSRRAVRSDLRILPIIYMSHGDKGQGCSDTKVYFSSCKFAVCSGLICSAPSFVPGPSKSSDMELDQRQRAKRICFIGLSSLATGHFHRSLGSVKLLFLC